MKKLLYASAFVLLTLNVISCTPENKLDENVEQQTGDNKTTTTNSGGD